MNRRLMIQSLLSAAAVSLIGHEPPVSEYQQLADALKDIPESIEVTSGGRVIAVVPTDLKWTQVEPHVWEITSMGTSLGTVTFEGNNYE